MVRGRWEGDMDKVGVVCTGRCTFTESFIYLFIIYFKVAPE